MKEVSSAGHDKKHGWKEADVSTERNVRGKRDQETKRPRDREDKDDAWEEKDKLREVKRY